MNLKLCTACFQSVRVNRVNSKTFANGPYVTAALQLNTPIVFAQYALSGKNQRKLQGTENNIVPHRD